MTAPRAVPDWREEPPQVHPALAFDLELDHGRCVAVVLPGPDGPDAEIDAMATLLVDGERAFAARLPSVRRRTWVGGRVALREALRRSGLDAPAVLPDARGAPALPAGVAGSITHKGNVAAALVSPGLGSPAVRVGVDVEIDVLRPHDIAGRVLTGDEAIELAGLDPVQLAREVLLRFSAKEAVYKALDPLVQRYVAFAEVGISPVAGGGAVVRASLGPGEGPFAIDVTWRRLQGLILTTARVEAL